MLEVREIYKKYRREEVLKGASFAAAPGDCVAVTGCNGSGKSTLLGIIAGLVRPESGKVLLSGQELANGHPDRRIGYAPQNAPLLEELSVRDNLSLWYSSAAMKESAEKGVLRALGVDAWLGKRVSRLSGGMKKRVSIAIAAAGSPKVLLLDEPSAALDPEGREVVHGFLTAYRQKGGIVVMVTHDVQDVLCCTGGFALRNGVLQPFAPGEVREGILY